MPFPQQTASATLHGPLHTRLRLALSAIVVISVLFSSLIASADDGLELQPLEESGYSQLAPFLGKVAAVPATPGLLTIGDTCTAVAVAPSWILTAAHCVHRKNADHAPWTPAYFDGMYPLDWLIFRQAPIGAGPIYRIVDYIKSDRFPDPSPASEDWIFLRLDRAMPMDAAMAPVVVPNPADTLGAEVRIAGFVRMFLANGRMDVGASNVPRVSRVNCTLLPFHSHAHGAVPGLAQTDCVLAINPGLSGAPMIVLNTVDPDGPAKIVALKMGAGQPAGTMERVPVLIESARFAEAYSRIVDTFQSPAMSSAGLQTCLEGACRR